MPGAAHLRPVVSNRSTGKAPVHPQPAHRCGPSIHSRILLRYFHHITSLDDAERLSDRFRNNPFFAKCGFGLIFALHTRREVTRAPSVRPPARSFTPVTDTHTVQGRAQQCTRTASKCKILLLQRHRATPLADTLTSCLSSGVCDWTNTTKKLCVTSQSKHSSVRRLVFSFSNTLTSCLAFIFITSYICTFLLPLPSTVYFNTDLLFKSLSM